MDVCPGFQPGEGWLNRKKCKICGHSQSYHEKQTPLPALNQSTSSLLSTNSSSKEKEKSQKDKSDKSHKEKKHKKEKSSKDHKEKHHHHKTDEKGKKSHKSKSEYEAPTSPRKGSEAPVLPKEDPPVVVDDHKDVPPSKPRSKSKEVVAVEPVEPSRTSSASSSISDTSDKDGKKSTLPTPALNSPNPKEQKKDSLPKARPQSPGGRRGSLGIPDDASADKDDEELRNKNRAQTLESREQVGDYILVDKLGKGAYGVVYKAINIFEGNTVAIKQLNLKGASKEVIESLQEEINLLQSLDHINIVRYIGHIRKGKELSIVMEYVENGSLAGMVKKYGRFPEPLARAYIRKVLDGLVYLHQQGVIHRDIKPDNILITKDGNVKLADFGVSTKLSSLKSNQVEDNTVPAGTPYYMAPEVIEFLGARPESDVWSLGCTVIELLRGEPPYFNFDPFSAMYKMVEDEHPPLPSGISLTLNDFLMSCFKKDVNMRPGAMDLSKHVWVVSADKPSATAAASKVAATPPKEYNQVIGEIEHYNEALEKQFHQEPSPDELQEQREIINKSLTLSQANKLKLKKQKEQRDAKKNASQTPKGIPSNAGSKKNSTGKSPSPPIQQKKQSLKLQVNSIDVGSLSKPPKQQASPKSQPKPADDEEDWDAEFGIESDAQPLKLQLPAQSKPADPKADLAASLMESLESFEESGTATLGFGGLSLDGISLEGLEPKPKPQTQGGKISTMTKKQLGGALQDLDNFMDDDDQDWSQLTKKAPQPSPGSRQGTVGRTGTKNLNKFAEADSDGFDDDFGNVDFSAKLKMVPHQQTQNTDDWAEELTIEEEQPLDEKVVLREKAQEALLFEIKELLHGLKPSQSEDVIKRTSLELMDIFNRHPEMRHHLITNHGLLPLITLLSGSSNTGIVNAVLRLITQIIESQEILVNLCIMGIIPVVMECGASGQPVLTRLYSAYFVQRVISSNETFQMFLACRGLSVLVDLLEPDYIKHKELVIIAIDCVSSIFKQSGTTTPKNEYFHLCCNVGLMERLSVSLVNLLLHKSDKDNSSASEQDWDDDEVGHSNAAFTEKAAEVFKVFSLGDADVKLRIVSDSVMPNLKKAVELMDPRSKGMLSMLNMIRNISFDRHTLNQLAIFIVPLLNIGMSFVKQNVFVKEIFNQVTHSLFHLCRLYHKKRQETAVKAGLIPFLMFVIANNKPLKDFAVPLLCELAKTSEVTRETLLANNGITFYIDILKDNSLSSRTFHTDALEALAVCTEFARERTESVLLQGTNLQVIHQVFINAGDHQLINLLDSCLKIVQASTAINRALGSDNSESGFVAILRNKLHHPIPHARVSLLRTLNVLCSKCDDPSHFLKENNLLKVVRFMAQNDLSNLVKNMAVTLLKEGGKS